jgi:hypothetical protein
MASYEVDDDFFSSPAYRVKGWQGIAFHVLGWETETRPGSWDCEIWDENECETVRTGKVVVCMVGDDRHFLEDPEDLTPLCRNEYGGVCGQIGCNCG